MRSNQTNDIDIKIISEHEEATDGMYFYITLDKNDLVIGEQQSQSPVDISSFPLMRRTSRSGSQVMGKQLVEESFVPVYEEISKQQMTFEQVQAAMFAINLGLKLDFDTEVELQSSVIRFAGLLPEPDGGEWQPGLRMAEGTIITHNSINFIVLQSHIAQSGWEPSGVPALFKEIREAYAEWVQPQGGHDAYMKGDRVIHNGEIWISDINANVWAPGVHGWSRVT